MTIIKQSKVKNTRRSDKLFARRYRIFSKYYKTEYTNSKVMAYVHYYAARMLGGGHGYIMDTWDQGENQ